MKKLFLITLVALMFIACNNKTASDSSKNADMQSLYEKNLAELQKGISAFENKDIEGWAATIADTAHWNSPMYGDTVHTKAHWKEALAYYIANWDNLKLNNATFLPGVDSLHEMDGSVRYYGSWDAVHKSGLKTSVNFYGTYDFNKDNKVVSGSDYFDVSGLMNAVSPKMDQGTTKPVKEGN